MRDEQRIKKLEGEVAGLLEIVAMTADAMVGLKELVASLQQQQIALTEKLKTGLR